MNWTSAQKVVLLSAEKTRLLAALETELDAERQARQRAEAMDAALRRSETLLAEKTTMLETTLERMDQGIMLVSADRIVEVCNRRAMELLDLPAEMMTRRPTAEEVLSYQWRTEEFVHTEADIQAFVRAGGMLDRIHIYDRKRPNGRHIEVRSVPHAGGIVRTFTDITDRKRAEQALSDSEQRFRALFSSLTEGVVMRDRDLVVLASNHSAERILGLTAEQMMRRVPVDPRWRAIHEDGSDYPSDEHPGAVAMRSGQALRGIVMGVHKPDGSLTWVSINAVPMFNPDEASPYAVVCSFDDITSYKDIENRLRLQTLTDPLTQIGNRRHFMNQSTVAVRRALDQGAALSLLMLDLDHFKNINDTYGHDAGDEVLKVVSSALRARVRDTDFLARMGGEEFSLLLHDVALHDAIDIAETLRATIEALSIATAGGDTLHITVSIGVAEWRRDEADMAHVMRRADRALYAAKAGGRNLARAI